MLSITWDISTYTTRIITKINASTSKVSSIALYGLVIVIQNYSFILEEIRSAVTGTLKLYVVLISFAQLHFIGASFTAIYPCQAAHVTDQTHYFLPFCILSRLLYHSLVFLFGLISEYIPSIAQLSLQAAFSFYNLLSEGLELLPPLAKSS